MRKIYFLLIGFLTIPGVVSSQWYARGQFNGWAGTAYRMVDDGTNGDLVSGDGIYSISTTMPSGNTFDWKATVDDWTTSYPANNTIIVTNSNSDVVLLTYDTNTYGDGWLPDGNTVNSYEVSLGQDIVCVGDHNSWNNAGAEVMVDDGTSNGDYIAGDGIYAWHENIGTAGTYGWKATISGTWSAWGADQRSLNYSAQNMVYTTTVPNQDVYYYLNVKTGRLYTSVGTALPVELTSFRATASSNEVVLNWQTATEVNNYGFEIQRSPASSNSDFAAATWQKIAFVDGHGNSNSVKSYSYTDKSVTNGKYAYRLKQIDIDGAFEYSDVVNAEVGIPSKYEMLQNYPNPFNPTTTIQFSIPEAANINLTVFNALGEQVSVLANGMFDAGMHKINFNASNLNSGIYFYQIKTQNFMQVKKMMLVK